MQRFSFHFIIVLNEQRQIGSTKTLLLHDPHFLISKLVTKQKLSRSTTKTSCQQIGSELAPCYCDGLGGKRIIHYHDKTKLISFKLPPLPPPPPSPPGTWRRFFFFFPSLHRSVIVVNLGFLLIFKSKTGYLGTFFFFEKSLGNSCSLNKFYHMKLTWMDGARSVKCLSMDTRIMRTPMYSGQFLFTRWKAHYVFFKIIPLNMETSKRG